MKKDRKPTAIKKKAELAKLLFILLQTFLTFLLSPYSHAESLDDIYNALSTKDLGKKPTPEAPQGDNWIERGSNLEKLFTNDGRNIALLKDWIGDLTDKQFHLSGEEKKKKKEYVALFASYSAPRGEILNVTILVPHPKYLSTINSGLLEDFHKQQPPGLKVSAIEKMIIKKHEATYYQHAEKGCSLLFKLPNNSTLNISDKMCNDSRGIVQLAELLNIDRLKQKLES